MLQMLAVSKALAGTFLLKANALVSMLFVADQHSLKHYLRTHYADRTFEHLYRWNPFDILLLIPYFTVMIVLAAYGIHRYQLVYKYYRNKKNYDTSPPPPFAELPLVHDPTAHLQ